MRSATCANCRFFGDENVEFDGRIYGTCRPDQLELRAERQRFIGTRENGGFLGEWPMVASDEWCGRHEPVDRTKADAIEFGDLRLTPKKEKRNV